MGRPRKDGSPASKPRPRGGLAATLAQTKESKPAKAKAPKAKEAADNGHAQTKGQLGSIYDHAVSAVIRALGKHGCSNERIASILKARKVKASPATISTQALYGRKGNRPDRPPAPLTSSQMDELLSLAPEPETEAAAAK